MIPKAVRPVAFLVLLFVAVVSHFAHAQQDASQTTPTQPATVVPAPTATPAPAAQPEAAPAPAQAAPAQSTLVSDQQAAIAALKTRVDSLQKQMDAGTEDDGELLEIRLELEEVSQQLLQSGVAFRPRLAEINQRLTQLGAPPADGQPAEPKIVSDERAALSDEKAQINAVIGSAESMSIQVSSMIDRIAEMRRDLFQSLLTRRYDIDYALFFETVNAFQSEMGDLYTSVGSWWRFVWSFKLSSVLGVMICAALAAAVLRIGSNRIFGKVFEPDPTVEEPSYLSRISVAFWSTLLPTATLAVFLSLTYLLFEYFGIMREDIGVIMGALFYVILMVFFVHRLGKGILAPKMPNWRLVRVRTGAARSLMWLVTATAFFSGIDYFFSTVYQVLGAPLTLTVGEALTATVVIGVLLILIGLVKALSTPEGAPRPWPWWVRFLLIALGGVTLVAALLGFIGFARFLSQQIVVTGAILITMYIGNLSARAMSEEGAFARTSFSRWLRKWFPLDESTLDQLGLVISIVINIFVVLIGLPLILLQWGFQWGDMWVWLVRAAGGFQIGSFSFSPVGIFTGIIVFMLGYFLTRWFQNWLDGSVMARGKVDTGVRNSISLVVGYAGMALAGIIAISAAGIDLSSLALVAGALSLGIGFGLQNIVSNFVSGLILLAERPFKVGDWVVAGTVSGTVRKISVRATEIETFQRQTMILPNSEFINSAVGNWTHRNKLGRVDIKVSVAYDSDAKMAYEIMKQIAVAHPLVLKNPEPFVMFLNFGAAGLEFEVRVVLADILNSGTVQNDIRFAILEEFEKAGIAIPSTPRAQPPVPDEPLHSASDDERVEAEHEALLAKLKVEAEKEEAKPRRRRPKAPDPA